MIQHRYSTRRDKQVGEKEKDEQVKDTAGQQQTVRYRMR